MKGAVKKEIWRKLGGGLSEHDKEQICQKLSKLHCKTFDDVLVLSDLELSEKVGLDQKSIQKLRFVRENKASSSSSEGEDEHDVEDSTEKVKSVKLKSKKSKKKNGKARLVYEDDYDLMTYSEGYGYDYGKGDDEKVVAEYKYRAKKERTARGRKYKPHRTRDELCAIECADKDVWFRRLTGLSVRTQRKGFAKGRAMKNMEKVVATFDDVIKQCENCQKFRRIV